MASLQSGVAAAALQISSTLLNQAFRFSTFVVTKPQAIVISLARYTF